MPEQKHILVVDDEPDIREVLTQALKMKGYRVTSAGTGEEALRLAKSDVPQLVISDLQMEDADGLELINQLKSDHPDLPVILLTGVIFDVDVVRDTISKKVSVYLDKTSTLQQVTSEVQRLLGDIKPGASAPSGQ